jgi:deoxyribonuclease-4
MRLGFHLSIAGGLIRAVERGLRTGCEAGQIFSRSPRGWAAKPIRADEAVAFRQAAAAADLRPLAVHLPYLPNLAAQDDALFAKSVTVLSEEMARAALLGADIVVSHPGHVSPNHDRNAALERVAQGLIQGLVAVKDRTVPRFLLENTSGQRGEVGSRFDELAAIINQVDAETRRRVRLGVCLDTAHAWAAGYDLASAGGLEATLAVFDRVLGLKRLGLIHFNDSLADLGGRRDRHAPVGRGRIGSRGMARFLRHPDLAHLAAVMETPRASEADDLDNMARAKRWRQRRPHREGKRD